MAQSTATIARPKKPVVGKHSASPALPTLFEAAVTGLSAHDLVTRGVTVADARHLVKAFSIIGEAQLYGVLGITPRTMQRRAASAHKTLDSNASDRALRLLSVTRQAIDVLGSQEAAERWLSTPATGLDQRKPIDLLQSSEGTELVKTLLTRMDFGVYA